MGTTAAPALRASHETFRGAGALWEASAALSTCAVPMPVTPPGSSGLTDGRTDGGFENWAPTGCHLGAQPLAHGRPPRRCCSDAPVVPELQGLSQELPARPQGRRE